MPYKHGVGWEPPKLPQYEEPDTVRDQRTPEDLKSMVSKQAEMRYGPALRELPTQHQQLQRQGQEAMAAQGLAGTGIATREAMIPIAQQHQRQLADILQEKGLYKQTAFDELEMRERDRTDQLIQQNFANWIAQRQLEGSLTHDDFSRWLSTQQHGLSEAQFREAQRQFQQTFGLDVARHQLQVDKFDWEKDILEEEMRRQEEKDTYAHWIDRLAEEPGMDVEGWRKKQAVNMVEHDVVDTVISTHQEEGLGKAVPWSTVEAALHHPENREIFTLHGLSMDEAYLAAWERYNRVVGDMFRGVPGDQLPEDYLRDLLAGKRIADRIRRDLYGEDKSATGGETGLGFSE